jgi:PIN domain nuclease of toxin-antitoxin system
VKLLLDTHIVLWAAYTPEHLSQKAKQLLSDPASSLYFSVASLWEVAIKSALGRADFNVDVAELRAGLIANDYSEVAIESRHVLRVPTLPPIHADPFDRILVAQAMAEGVVLLSNDAKLKAYGGPVWDV